MWGSAGVPMKDQRGTVSPFPPHYPLQLCSRLAPHILIRFTHENAAAEGIYALDDDTDTGAEAHALPASMSGPSHDDNVYYVHEEVALLSDHSCQGSMSRSGSLLAPVLAPRSGFKTCGLFDSPGHTPL